MSQTKLPYILMHSAEQTRAILDSLIAFVGIVTPNGILIEANQTALLAANLQPSDVIGKPFEDAYWWSYDASVQELLRAAIRRAAGGETVRYDVAVRVANDRRILIDFMLVPHRDATGNVSYIVPSAVDITERANALQKLRDSETRLRVAMEAAQMGIWEILLATDQVWRSESTDSIFGLEPREGPVPVDLFVERVHPDDRQRVVAAIDDAVMRRGDHYVEYRVLLPGGTIRWVASRGSVQVDAEGQATRLIGAIVDITDRVRAEQVLRESEDLFRATFDQAAIGIAHVGLNGEWLRVNQALCHIIGYSRAELFEMTFQQMTHPEDLHSDLELFEQLKVGAIGSYSLEKRYFHQNGSIVWVNLRVSLVRDAEPPYCISFIENITERKRQQEEIQSLNARLQRAMAETHHRIKNNLQIIAALVEISVGDATEAVPLSSISRIGQHVRTLADLHDLLTQQAKAGVTADAISVRYTLDRLVEFLSVTAGERRIELTADDVPISVRSTTALALLVNELVANAVKHGRGTIEIHFRARESVGELIVCDNGPGFPDDFSPATSVSTGLTLIESAGQYDLRGTIAYVNRPEGGACVRVAFPLPA